MRQSHPAGERIFVDYAGQTVELADGRSGRSGRPRSDAATAPAVRLARRIEPGDRRTCRRSQHKADAPPGCQPPESLPRARQPGADSSEPDLELEWQRNVTPARAYAEIRFREFG